MFIEAGNKLNSCGVLGSLAQDASADLAKATQMLEDFKTKMTELIPADFAANAQ